MKKNGLERKKESIKLHIAVDDVSKKIILFRVTKGNIHAIDSSW